jgi:hypothetical protein
VSASGVDSTEQVDWLQETVTCVIVCRMQYGVHWVPSCVVEFLYDYGDCRCSPWLWWLMFNIGFEPFRTRCT